MSSEKSSSGYELLSNLAENGKKIFSLEEAKNVAKTLNISENYLNLLLYRLKKNKWISTLKNGVYILEKGFSLGPLHEFEIAMALLSPVAISHYSALHYHGLTDQLPIDVFLLTTSKPPLRRQREKWSSTFEFRGVLYRFIRVKESRFFGIHEYWINESKVRITDPERTLIDGLSRPELCGGFEEVIHAFTLIKEKLNLEKIIQYALKIDFSTVKRLGWVLSQIGYLEKDLIDLLDVRVTSFVKLDHTRPSKGKYHSKWMIQENLYG